MKNIKKIAAVGAVAFAGTGSIISTSGIASAETANYSPIEHDNISEKVFNNNFSKYPIKAITTPTKNEVALVSYKIFSQQDTESFSFRASNIPHKGVMKVSWSSKTEANNDLARKNVWKSKKDSSWVSATAIVLNEKGKIMSSKTIFNENFNVDSSEYNNENN